MVEKAIDRLLTVDPISDERAMVLPWRLEKARLVNPSSVEPISVDTFMVLPLRVETVKRFTFSVDAATLDTVMALPVRVE
jgi:hypothetical protein